MLANASVLVVVVAGVDVEGAGDGVEGGGGPARKV